jgi:cobyrinic acid a,c-diamide synthase
MDSAILPPRILVAALRGGAGKTILSVGLAAAWRDSGQAVRPFKKGPDYIDAGWLALAAGQPCYNLDTYLASPGAILDSFLRHSDPAAISLIEGNRGLYDCIDTDGSTSSAELAKLLAAPVLVCLDCTKTTRTMAAVVDGLCRFDPRTPIAGVILNRVAGARHENILRSSITGHCRLPVLGAVPRLSAKDFPERHMGLVPTAEHAWAREAVAAAAQMACKYLDLQAIAAIAAGAPAVEAAPLRAAAAPRAADGSGLRIGVMRDSAFQFYYPENIEALGATGARVVPVSPLSMRSLPDLDALYIGGGFPETHAAALSANGPFRDQLKRLADGGLPIYAECGGLMYLGEELLLEEGRFPMAGILPVVFGFGRRPQGHGYTRVRVVETNPYFETGRSFRGHEFHYSRVIRYSGEAHELVLSMERGKGLVGERDGLCRGNVFATYTHLHALGTPEWAQGILACAAAYRGRRGPRLLTPA